MKIKSGV